MGPLGWSLRGGDPWMVSLGDLEVGTLGEGPWIGPLEWVPSEWVPSEWIPSERGSPLRGPLDRAPLGGPLDGSLGCGALGWVTLRKT